MTMGDIREHEAQHQKVCMAEDGTMRPVASILQVELLSWKSSKDISNDGGGSLCVP